MMKSLRLPIPLFLILLLTFAPVAQGNKGQASYAPRNDLPLQPLTIEKAIEYGLEHNRSLKSALEDVSASKEQVNQARAGFFPRLDASYSYTRLKVQPFATLGSKGLGGFPSEFPVALDNVNRWQIDVTQPLFTGFNLTAQLNISKMDLKMTKLKLQSARLDLIRNIKHAFLQTLLGEKLVEVAKNNVKNLEIQRRNAKAYYQQGLTAKNDVLKADVALAEARQKERATVKQLVILRSRLNQLLDLPIDTKLTLKDRETPIKPLPDLDELFETAKVRRPELLTLNTAIRQAEESIRAAESGYYPHLAAFGQYYREGEDFFADNNPLGNEYNASVGVKMEWNLFEGGKTRAAANQFKYRKRSLEEQYRDLEQQIRIQIEDAYEQIKVAEADIATARAALAQAKENERMTTFQYKEQLVIFLEVLNARVFSLQSSVNYYEAVYGYQTAWADLERAVGEPFFEKVAVR